MTDPTSFNTAHLSFLLAVRQNPGSDLAVKCGMTDREMLSAELTTVHELARLLHKKLHARGFEPRLYAELKAMAWLDQAFGDGQ